MAMNLQESLDGLTDSQFLLPENRIRVAAYCYGAAVDKEVSVPPTEAERVPIADWLRQLRQEGQPSPVHRRSPDIRPAVHATWVDKVRWLQMRTCDVCDLWVGPGLPVSFDVPIKPFTAQTKSERLRDLKGLVTRHLRSSREITQGWSRRPVCLQIVAVLGCDDRIKDVDNMVKGLVDSFQGALYKNDSEVQHLDVTRFRAPDTRGAYLVMARPVRALDEDVMDRNRPVQWRRTPLDQVRH